MSEYFLFGDIMSTILTLLILATTIFTAVNLSLYLYGARVKKLINISLNKVKELYSEKRIQDEIRRYTKTIDIKMDFTEKMELKFIYKSNIQHYIPFINFKLLIIITVFIFIITFIFIYRALNFIPSSLIIGILAALTPFVALDLLGKRNADTVRKKMALFVSSLNRWCAVKEDIIFALEKSALHGIGEPLRTFVRDAVIQLKSGLDVNEALSILQMKVESEQFQNFIMNLRQNIKHRGDLGKLLSSLEDEFFKLEEEYERRKITTYSTRAKIYSFMAGVLVSGYMFLKLDPGVESFYFGTDAGKMLIAVFLLIYLIAFAISTRITNFNY